MAEKRRPETRELRQHRVRNHCTGYGGCHRNGTSDFMVQALLERFCCPAAEVNVRSKMSGVEGDPRGRLTSPH
ncbi:MAG: hypothetical protein WA826_19400 [Silvibacterium sp.]